MQIMKGLKHGALDTLNVQGHTQRDQEVKGLMYRLHKQEDDGMMGSMCKYVRIGGVNIQVRRETGLSRARPLAYMPEPMQSKQNIFYYLHIPIHYSCVYMSSTGVYPSAATHGHSSPWMAVRSTQAFQAGKIC